jgi:hypothetical protein
MAYGKYQKLKISNIYLYYKKKVSILIHNIMYKYYNNIIFFTHVLNVHLYLSWTPHT